MEYLFDAYGPFLIIREDGRISQEQAKFWEHVETKDAELHSAIGCYLFCLKYGKNFMPVYVGMTVAKTGYEREIFTEHKMNLYNHGLNYFSGAPMMFLFPFITQNDNFARPSKYAKDVIEQLEKMLIGFAYRRNPFLENTRDTAFLKDTTIFGVFGDPIKGRPAAGRSEARSALFGPRLKNKISN